MNHRSHVLWLYRQFLRVGRSLAETSPNHSLYVLGRAKHEFKRGLHFTESEDISFHTRLAEAQLESLRLAAPFINQGTGKHRAATGASVKEVDPFAD